MNIILGDTNSTMFTPTKLDSNAKCLKFTSQTYQYKQIKSHENCTYISYINWPLL